MARKSVDFTLSLERFQLQRKQSSPIPTPFTNTHKNSHSNSHSNSPQLNPSMASSSSVALQNRQLARSNSAMAIRIQQLETTITDLSNENSRLRAISASASTKEIPRGDPCSRSLEKRIKALESNLACQFDEVFQTLKQLRHECHLDDNPMLDALASFSRPVTSTPLSQEFALDVLFPSFGDPPAIVAPSPVRVSMDQPLASELPEESTVSESVSAADMSFVELDEPSVPDYLCSPILEDSAELAGETEKQSKLIIEVDTHEFNKNIPVLRPSSSDSPHINGDGSEKESISADPQKILPLPSESIDVTSEISASSSSALSQPVSVRRSRRAKKPVDYKLPSMHRKLRRESESLSPAVGNSDSEYFVRKSVVVYSNPDEDPQPAPERKQEEGRKRTALTNVTDSSNNKRRRNLNDDEVFDIPKGSLKLQKRRNSRKHSTPSTQQV